MDYRDKFYKKYVSSHTKNLYGDQSLEKIRSQFPVRQSYFGRFLPKDKNVKILDLGYGSGGFIYWFLQSGFKNATGIDISEGQRENILNVYGFDKFKRKVDDLLNKLQT